MSVDTTGGIYFYCGTTDGSVAWTDASPQQVWTSSNFIRAPVKTPIYDLRGKEDQFNIDLNGFEVLKYNGKVHNPFDDNSEEKKCLYDEITNVLKDRLGASRVIIFNHIIRARGPAYSPEQCDNNHKNPVLYPHADNDPAGAHIKRKQVLGEEEVMKVAKKRFQIINIWRPLGPNPVVNMPLTICDYRTIDINHDVHSINSVGSQISMQSYMISKNANDQHRWNYLRNMTSNEMFIFKIFDSNETVARFGAHTAFVDDNASPSDLQQTSIEMRALIIYD